MGPGLCPPVKPLEALAQSEVAVVRRRVHLEQRLERLARALGLARIEVRPPEGLEDRPLARLEPIGTLEDDRRLGVVPSVEKRLAALEQVVCGLELLVVIGRIVGSEDCMRGWWHGARRGATGP